MSNLRVNSILVSQENSLLYIVAKQSLEPETNPLWLILANALWLHLVLQH